MGVCDFCDDYNYGIKQVAGNDDFEYGIKQAGNDDYNYDKGRYLFFFFFSTRCSREKNLLIPIPAAAGFFSLDATYGLLPTRRGNSFRHALSFCGVELYV